jgi:hypothetical protein
MTMEFLDPQGKVIRTFTGTAADGEKPAAPPPSDDEGGNRRPPEPHPPVTAGLHRQTWDMRYAGPTDFPGMIMWAASARGPQAPPGNYQVRVTVDGQTETQPFVIRREPHVLKDVTDQDLRDQFDLAIRVRDKVSAANEAVLLARGVKKQIAERKQKLDAKHTAAIKALDDFDRGLSAIEGEIYQVRLQSSQDPLNFPIKLNNKIAALQGVVESADAKPTDQTIAMFADMSARLDQQLQKLDALISASLPAINQQLQRRKLEPLKKEGQTSTAAPAATTER